MGKSETKNLTLCDGCILILVFGIAAAVVSPRLSQAVERDKVSDLVDRLYTIRTQIKLYKIDHDGLLPGQTLPGGAVNPEAFADALQQERPDGLGPYLEELPKNPFITDSALDKTVTCVNNVDLMPAGNERTAWWFNAATGEFYACDSKFHTNY